MINTKGMSPERIKEIGFEILARELGPDAFIKFIQQFDIGSGNYTKERSAIFKDLSAEQIGEAVIKHQNRSK